MLKLPMAVLVIAGVSGVSSVASAISLGELAAHERERRKGLTARLYTNEDLLRVSLQRGTFTSIQPLDPAPFQVAAGTPPVQPAEGGAKSEDEVRAEREKAWRERLQQANDDVTRLSADVERLQYGLNDLSQNLYGAGRRAQIARLEEAKGQLVAARQAVESIEEEGRRSSFRP